MAVQKVVYQTPNEHFRRIYFEVIDCISGEITNRFDQPSFTFIQSVEEILIDVANGKEVQIPPAVTECYRNDLDFDRLISNCKAFTIYVAIIAK